MSIYDYYNEIIRENNDTIMAETAELIQKQVDAHLTEIFWAGFQHGLAVQEDIFREEHPEVYAENYPDTERSAERRKLVDALEAFIEASRAREKF